MLLAWLILLAPTEEAVRLVETKGVVRVRVGGLDQEALKDAKKWTASVYVDRGAKAEQLPVLGKWTADGDALVFAPRFPLVKGLRYRVAVTVGGKATDATVSIPKPESKPTTVVSRVYPTADKLPENQLKFYLHFSAPMTQGGAYTHLSLVDAKGKKVDLPFLELDQELWDPTGTRFTLFFDPGRVKRGLKPREEFGPVLEEGKSYTLVIDRTWHDAEGNPLKEMFTKSFSVGPPDDVKPDIKTWKLRAPTGDAALRVTFPKPMDHALSHRIVWVEDEKGRRVEGKTEFMDRETAWSFTPQKPWAAGKYRLVADTRLEDLSGNSLGRLFEVDVLKPVEGTIKTETVSVPFEVK